MSSYLSNLLLHPKTKIQADLLLQKPTGSVLILGAVGSGKLNLSMAVSAGLLKLDSVLDLDKYPYFLHIKKAIDRQDISIDQIREIIRALRLKTPGRDGIKRSILIEDAQYLSAEAQNALLKILEEPNDDTVFILTAPNALSLLPTIVSRCQILQVYPVTLKQAASYFAKDYSSGKIETAWQLSQGSAALLAALLTEDDTHSLKQAIEHAKSFLKNSRYERLLFLDKLSKNKEEHRVFIEALARVLAALQYSSLIKGNTKQSKKLLHDRRLVARIADALDNNANLKLINMELLLNLSV